ncbi:MAG: hypothetical protein INH41_21625, partial [Myxococcaceae bacterium]|nr:hypothetical protein [Myxococcaceae bacterium]
TGTFEARWEARPTHTPERAGVIRLKKNDGSWLATARDDGKTWLVHRFAVDPGGWVPAFAANLGNQQGVTDTYRNVEREAQKRTRERLASPGAAQTKPAPQVLPAVADMTPPPPGPPAGAEAKPAAGASSPAAGPGAP